MRRIMAILAMVCALPVVLPAGEFNWLVREFSRESGAKPMRIPLFGVVRFAVRVAQPGGASELNLAVFEHVGLDPQRFSSMADEAIEGGGWKPMIRVRSRNGERTNIYAQVEDAQRLRLVIATLDGSADGSLNDRDATFVEVQIRTQELMKFVDEHRGEAAHN